ncbi:hypothetical protein AWN68_02930 [Roseivirga echinicomitans]|uniref:DUF4221 domain-containing protein n=1 Tax=Roseivirga echinicomitans TaxID=296218 RepID=A0A150XYM5_9BACT|nr:hypothetical protein AWN68_02930 [Roseivirga echinicomitans]
MVACNGNKENSESKIGNFKTEIVDSLVINRLSMVELLDYQSTTGELLFADVQSGDYLVMDKDGKVLSSFNPHIEGPNYMGNSSYGWSFYGKDELVAFGRPYFYRFSKAGKIMGRYEVPIETGGGVYLDFSQERIRAFETQRGTEVLALVLEVSGKEGNNQNYQDSTDAVFRMNFETGETTTVMHKAPDNVYRTAGEYIDWGYPSFTLLSGSTFAFSHRSDNYLYIFDAEKNEYLNKMEIPDEFLPKYKAVAFGSKDDPELLRVNAKVFTIGDKILLLSVARIPNAVMEELQRIPNFYESQELDAAVKKYIKTDFLLFDQQQFLGKVEWDINLNEALPKGTENDFLWLKRTYKDERDYQTFLKVKIVKE